MGGQPIAPLEKRELAIRATEYDRVALPHIVAIADAAEPLVRRNSRPENPHSSWGVPPPLVCARGSGSPPTRAPHAAAASPLELRALLALGTLVRTSWELLFLCVTADVKVDGSFEVTSRFVSH